MAISLSIVRRKQLANGGESVLFSDGFEINLSDRSAFDQYVNLGQLETELMPDVLRRVLLGYAVRPGNVSNKAATFDVDQPSGNVVRIQ